MMKRFTKINTLPPQKFDYCKQSPMPQCFRGEHDDGFTDREWVRHMIKKFGARRWDLKKVKNTDLKTHSTKPKENDLFYPREQHRRTRAQLIRDARILGMSIN